MNFKDLKYFYVLLLIYGFTNFAYAVPEKADLLTEARVYTMGSRYPITAKFDSLAEKITADVLRFSNSNYDQSQYSDLKSEYQKQGVQDPLELLDQVYKDAEFRKEVKLHLMERLSQTALDIPGLKAPVLLRSNKTVDEIIDFPYERLTRYEQTALLGAVLLDSRFAALGGRTLIEILKQSLGFHFDFWGDLNREQFIGFHQLLFYVPDTSEWSAILREVGDPSQSDAFGYSAHDPENRLSLVMINGDVTHSFSEDIKVIMHEFVHVIQHRMAESYQIDLYRMPLKGKLVSLVLEGTANAASLLCFEAIGQGLASKVNNGLGFDFLARSLWWENWELGAPLDDRRIGANLMRLLFRSDRGVYRSTKDSPLFRSLLEAVIETRGLDHILWSAQMTPELFLAPLNFTARHANWLSASEREQELEGLATVVRQHQRDWLRQHFEEYDFLKVLICQGRPCDSFSEKDLDFRIAEKVQSGEVLIWLELSRQKLFFTERWQQETNQKFDTKIILLPLEKWKKAERDLFLNLLLTKVPMWTAKNLLERLAEFLASDKFIFSEVPVDNLVLHSCTLAENRLCSTAAEYEERAESWKTIVTLRLDGHSLIEIVQSAFHELTHHLHYAAAKTLHKGINGSGGAFLQISEGVAMFSAMMFPQVLSDAARDPLSREYLKLRTFVEANREGPNFPGAILMSTLWQESSQLNWQKSWLKMVDVGATIKDAEFEELFSSFL